MENHEKLKSEDYNDDVTLAIKDFPEQWNGKDKTIKFRVVTSKKVAIEILERIFEEVHRNLISAHIDAKHSKHSVHLDVVLHILAEEAISVSMGYLLADIKDRLTKWENSRASKKK